MTTQMHGSTGILPVGTPGVSPGASNARHRSITGRDARCPHRQDACATRAALVIALTLLGIFSAPALTLDAALARTLEKNPAIQEAKARLEQAAGRRLVLRATGLPDAAVFLPGGVQGGKRAGEDAIQPFAFVRGLFAQPLFNAAVPAAYRRGNIEVLLAQQRLNVTVIEQLHTARVAFYTASYNDSLRALGEAQRLRLEGNVRAQTERLEAGKADRAAVMMARVLEQELKPRIEEARRIYNAALLQLAGTMGGPLAPGGKLPATDGALQFVPVQVDVESAARLAIAQRPDLQLARLLVRAASEDQRMIEAAYYPAINATISGDYIPVSDIRRGSEGSPRRSDDIISSELRAGAAYTWRVVDNGQVRGAAIRQRAVREINELVLAKLEADVPRELTRIDNTLRALAARHNSLAKGAAVAEETVSAVQNNLLEGLASQLEYRTAESSFLETKGGVLTVAFQQNIARAEWDRATGRYFQFFDNAGNLH